MYSESVSVHKSFKPNRTFLSTAQTFLSDMHPWFIHEETVHLATKWVPFHFCTTAKRDMDLQETTSRETRILLKLKCVPVGFSESIVEKSQLADVQRSYISTLECWKNEEKRTYKASIHVPISCDVSLNAELCTDHDLLCENGFEDELKFSDLGAAEEILVC